MLNFLNGGGRMAEQILAYDWSDHPLGPPEQWPATLKTTVAIVLSSHFPQCIVWGADLTTIPNDAFLPILGRKPPALGRPFSEVWSEVWNNIGPIAERAYAGEPTFIEDYPLEIEREGNPESAWFTFCYSPVRDEYGKVVGMLDTVIETTPTVLGRKQSEVVAQELVHRVKNALAVAQAIAAQTLRGEISLADARERLESRLQAMARTHDVLIRSDWNEADVADIINHIVAPHLDHPERAIVEGPRVVVTGRQTLSLALAIHELATNASKYGALSAPEGRIAIRWTRHQDGTDSAFVLTWQESGSPTSEEPSRKGFGTQILTRMLPADFQGHSDLTFEAEGLRFTLTAPASALATVKPSSRQ
ncbi:hypothetical protein LK12_06535 [Novosphingobium malaysiense]|uniref:histidine kinase n=2 Tax=Novosphingobium malaysiense TaxID=1348853 RepID=A0A0B1ZQ59_9SPHN|nr:hypothetical protein LK12_06535 [Novosphingobium malaysiense]